MKSQISPQLSAKQTISITPMKATHFWLIYAAVFMVYAILIPVMDEFFPGGNDPFLHIGKPIIFLLCFSFFIKRNSAFGIFGSAALAGIGIFFAFILGIILGSSFHPIAHNLLPFELLIYLVLIPIPVLVGSITAYYLNSK